MEIFDAVILGIVQGLTEFLPVSSSGHLEIAKVILGGTSVPEESLMVTVVLHFATALSTIVVFRKDVAEIFTGLLKFKKSGETEFSLKIILSMIPAALVGVFFEEELELLFGGNLIFVGFMLLITALLLWLADQAKNTEKPVSYKGAFIIGLAQAVALLPGISRSGATISTSVLLGTDKTKAARFSFLMVVPLILGKIAKDLIFEDLSESTIDFLPLFVGFIAAFIAGIAACTWMIALVRKSKLTYFAIYCLVVGLIAIGFSLF